MRKLLLLLFLYSLVSGTAFSKDKMEWLCGFQIYLIDLEIPEVYRRDLGKWEPMSSFDAYEKIIYDPDQENITLYATQEYIDKGLYQTVFDLRYKKHHPMGGSPRACTVSVFKE